MRNFLAMPQVELSNMSLEPDTLTYVQMMLRANAIKLVTRMHLSEQCIKEVGELQVIAVKLFSSIDPNTQKNVYLEEIRFKLKNEEQMNYRHVLSIKKLLD
mmetsp:Transcript_2907/g.3454  ORF Transcript_2907/g.3454 Transcript_2907/m.3454 type:complete len:101 (-) Transcript_2907:178-480(-)